MAKINLLPWRLERRKQKQKEFITMLGAAAAIAVGLSVLIILYYNGQISGQQNRNTYLTNEIATIEKQIEEIKGLDELSQLPPEYPGWMLERQSQGRMPQE